jgi:hypothetical protein
MDRELFSSCSKHCSASDADRQMGMVVTRILVCVIRLRKRDWDFKNSLGSELYLFLIFLNRKISI